MKVTITGDKQWVAFLKKVPRGTKFAAMNAAAEYIAGDETHGLRHEPAPTTQRYVRTHNLRNSWRVVAENSDWRRVHFTNDTSYARHVPPMWGPGGYINYGWLPWARVVVNNLKGAIQRAQAAVNAWIRAHKP